MVLDNPKFKLLSYKQKCIIERANKNGYITLKELKFIYSAPQNMKNAVERLVDLNILRPTGTHGVWVYVPYETEEKIVDPQTKLGGIPENVIERKSN
jgi:hypothetical protein